MDKKILAIISVMILLAAIVGCYFAFSPHYKTIEMSGYTFEVPKSNAEVKNNTINYNTYLDTEYDLNIKTWSCKDINDTNGTNNASTEMRMQLEENMGNNTTYNNITLYNKSGTYTYYEADVSNSCMILITSKNLNNIEHILKTMHKPELKIGTDKFNMSDNGLIITEPKNNTTKDTQISTTKTAKKSSKKQSSRESIYMDVDPESTGEYIGVGEGIYRNKKTGKIYQEHGRGNLVRSPELDNSPYLLG